MTDVAIFGCGGVGSNLAYMLSKSTEIKKMYLIDHDVIESSNLSRQFFIKEDVGKNKAEALATTLQQFAPDMEFMPIPQKMESTTDLAQFNNLKLSIIAYICTDNVPSKKLISDYFNYRICLGCDQNIVEMTSRFSDRAVWSIGEGYNSNQDFESNLFAATLGYMLYVKGQFNLRHKKIMLNELVKEIIDYGFEKARREDTND